MRVLEPTSIGRLRHQLRFQQRQGTTADSAGQRQGTWTTIASPMGNIEPISAREVERAKSFAGITTHKITIRHRANLATTAGRKLQVVYQGRTFVINGILNPEEQNVRLEVFCQELT